MHRSPYLSDRYEVIKALRAGQHDGRGKIINAYRLCVRLNPRANWILNQYADTNKISRSEAIHVAIEKLNSWT